MSTISKINGTAIGSISKINGIAKANISKVNGILIPPTGTWQTPIAIHSECGEEVSYPSTNTIDGSLSTNWRHGIYHEHWIILDLGSTKTVQKVRLYVRNSLAGDTCGVSAVYINNTADESGGSKGSSDFTTGTGWKEIDVTDTAGRYIKLVMKTVTSIIPRVCGNTVSLAEFREFQYFA